MQQLICQNYLMHLDEQEDKQSEIEEVRATYQQEKKKGTHNVNASERKSTVFEKEQKLIEQYWTEQPGENGQGQQRPMSQAN